MFGEYCSAVGDAGAAIAIILVLPERGKRRRTREAEWKMMRMPL